MHRSHVMSWLVTVAVLSSHIVIERPTSGSTSTPAPAAQALPPQQATATALAPPKPLPAPLTNPSRTPASAHDRSLIASLVEDTYCDGLAVPHRDIRFYCRSSPLTIHKRSKVGRFGL
jgi:hypothetical protein